MSSRGWVIALFIMAFATLAIATDTGSKNVSSLEDIIIRRIDALNDTIKKINATVAKIDNTTNVILKRLNDTNMMLDNVNKNLQKLDKISSELNNAINIIISGVTKQLNDLKMSLAPGDVEIKSLIYITLLLVVVAVVLSVLNLFFIMRMRGSRGSEGGMCI